jgi:hypothetical protein
MSLSNTILLASTLLETPITSQAVSTIPLGTALLLFTVLLLLLVIALVWNSKEYQVPETILAHDHRNDRHSGPKPSDDLTVIEGIGPKTAAAFQEAGIHTYQDLAGTDVEKLKKILGAANLRLAAPSTWPRQAQLAADGDWQSLRRLQDELTAGRQASGDAS